MFAYKNETKYYNRQAKWIEVFYWIGLFILIGSNISLYNLPDSIISSIYGLIIGFVVIMTIYMRFKLRDYESSYNKYKNRYIEISETLRALDKKIQLKKLIEVNTEHKSEEKHKNVLVETMDDKGNIGDWSFYDKE